MLQLRQIDASSCTFWLVVAQVLDGLQNLLQRCRVAQADGAALGSSALHSFYPLPTGRQPSLYTSCLDATQTELFVAAMLLANQSPTALRQRISNAVTSALRGAMPAMQRGLKRAH